ncbi:uncharacterized protein PITG_12421 [Phytophthora infestans T30-4]|uniref:Uncharacterized protein n=1 Tax=Phytophthora infestans (strain T30-4) TaxID=403677 RepID=D0NKG9_PHYIT|nr:uncharacterized protein PITG_12421 [Phytophthora infestans T30-4]EEY60105.1 conserved hypothetical protein [Phytophthora infestans T30-4]|eukprot:XP_002900312.1 conserved hypothetical protein [Phytophthora infestans T30-4]
MIMNHALEIPRPPTFLVQTMDAEELAVSTDLFPAMEYPLYKCLAPGQKFEKDMPREMMLRFIKAGEKAAPKQKQEAASKWIGWNMPFGSKLLPITDYKGQRERVRKTHETCTGF